MLTNDDYRRALGRPDMTDAEVDAVRADLEAWLNTVLDDYFRNVRLRAGEAKRD